MAGNATDNHQDRRRQKTVLVVDDSVELLTAVRLSLEPKGFQVLQTSNPFAGVRLAAGHQPDVIVMDLDMPGMDGKEAARFLQRVEETRGIPIIAFSSQLAVTEGLEGCGFARIVDKASGLEHLETEIENVLRPGIDRDSSV